MTILNHIGCPLILKTESGRVLNHICCDNHKENDHIFIHVMSLLCEIYSVDKLNDIIGKSIIYIIHNKDTIIGVEPNTEKYNLEKHCKYLNNFC